MESSKFIFLLVIFGAAAIYGQRFSYTEVQLKGTCPRIKYINNFNFPRIVGWYYEAFASISSSQCYNNNEGLACYVSPYDDHTITINFCCRSATNSSIATCGRDVASGTVSIESTPGEMTYRFKNKVYKIYVLDTDYENFSIVYGCNPGSGRHSGRDELILVHSRSYRLSKALENRVRRVIEENGGDWSIAKPIKQGSTVPYTPNSPYSQHCG